MSGIVSSDIVGMDMCLSIDIKICEEAATCQGNNMLLLLHGSSYHVIKCVGTSITDSNGNSEFDRWVLAKVLRQCLPNTVILLLQSW